MAPQVGTKKKRVNKRRSRTEVSSSSSSSASDSERSASPSPSVDEAPAAAPKSSADEEKPKPAKKPILDSNEVFSDFYLKQTTKEFSEDLDKLRGANDFNAKSVPVLIEALKQGTACFSKEEASRIGTSTTRTS
ncbi:Hypothetical protein R9X50_00075200 [Acrodontium crateriforme]|uniref:Ribosome assembly protein 3 n=1 Tax=Acrodontium crateriforme TaxID=150365 RepID=A0AAQ3LY49_9PEZI|nr:Hypothetical protein R9X50_00075200 [Acrodontium crateriforme]